jgi:hypothetical protein
LSSPARPLLGERLDGKLAASSSAGALADPSARASIGRSRSAWVTAIAARIYSSAA